MKEKIVKVGVLALQGAFREHIKMLKQCGAEAIEVRTPEELQQVDGLIIPGGESTTIGKLMVEWGLMDAIKAKASQGMAVYGTCAGMILLSKEIIGSDQPRLGLLDAAVQRNAFGRQKDSFEADMEVPEFGKEPVTAVFIRAPYIEKVGPEVKVMAVVNDKIVIARQGKVLATAFHPELTQDTRIHEYFLKMIRE